MTGSFPQELARLWPVLAGVAAVVLGVVLAVVLTVRAVTPRGDHRR
jgi:hypothetical protein